jgi:dipeptidyl aminopeptidase/acylaminoacyl peptidase
MKTSALAVMLAASSVLAQVPDNLVVEGVPPFTPELRAEVGRYLEFRAAGFLDWHPSRREVLITTRFGDTPQLHLVSMPGGSRKQLTFSPEPVRGAMFQPGSGGSILFQQDTGGGEFYQLHRYDLANGRTTLLTDGKSRNTGPLFSPSGKWLAYSSTKRTGRDTDIRLLNPADPSADRVLLELDGGGWQVADWSKDERTLLVQEYVSINESYLWVADTETGRKTLITPRSGDKIAWGDARFARDGLSVYSTSDRGTEFQQLVRIDLANFRPTVLTKDIPWDVEAFDLSPDGETIAFVTNDAGSSRLHIRGLKKWNERTAPRTPMGVITGLKFHQNSQDLAFTLSSAKSPSDVFSYNLKSGTLDRWTESESGGLNPESFIEPSLVKISSFDKTEVSAFLYRPDAKKFPGKRPLLIAIHGGPESQSRPGFQARNNYYLNELGIALLVPNVRGSAGYGKTFLVMDNGYKREDSVKDIGAFIDWARTEEAFDPDRIGVVGGSYGGYMVLASMIHFDDRLRCGVDIVGISNFLTFLKNTQDYRRDLRRAEYGDERQPDMAKFLEEISPTTRVDRLKKPLFVVQGKNDPRVPVTEAEQMVKALRDQGGTVWYLMAKDEGHGFAKKANADFQFMAQILFFREHLLK